MRGARYGDMDKEAERGRYGVLRGDRRLIESMGIVSFDE